MSLGSSRLPSILTVSQVKIQASLAVVLEVLSKPPYIRCTRMAFLRKPVLDFSLKPLGPVDVTAIPIISQIVSYIVDQALAPLVEPSFLDFQGNEA